MAAKIDLDAALEDKSIPPLEEATLQYKCVFSSAWDLQTQAV